MSEPLTLLGQPVRTPTRKLETFPAPEHLTQVVIALSELTARCPVTKQPDFYIGEIAYTPRGRCLETKSLKLYLETLRDEGVFAEHLASRLAESVSAATGATTVVMLTQHTRGGMQITATAGVDPDE